MPRVVVLCAVLAACAEVPIPASGEAASLAVTTDSAGTHVKGRSFELAFPVTGVKLPSHLFDAAGVDLLARDATCAAASSIGISAAPAITLEGGATATASALQIQDAGPAIVKAHVTYAAAYSCPDATQLAGATDFTIFPSGRIVREDIGVQATTQPLALAASCGCASTQQNFNFSTFWAFAGTGASQVLTDGSAVSAGATQACTMYSDHGVAVSFAGGTGTTTGFHLGSTSAHLLYWVEDATSLATDTRSMTSAINLGTPGQSCAQLMRPLYDSSIDIGGTVYASTDHDGIYRDTVVRAGAFDIKTTMTIAPGWAVSVDLGGVDHAAITRTPDLGTTVAVTQRELGTRYLIFFPDGLAAGETITLNPQ
ncbi:hypothetical protein BH11MYX1_BH11MYX1_19330 [soil metagenome]